MSAMSRMFLFLASNLPRRSMLSSTSTGASRQDERVNEVNPSSFW